MRRHPLYPRIRQAVGSAAVSGLLLLALSVYGCTSPSSSSAGSSTPTPAVAVVSTGTPGATFSGCETDTGAYHQVTADLAKQMIDAGGVTIVDVRTAGEYTEGHIPGAYNLPLDSIGTARPSALPDTGANLLVYCRTGVRSKQASDKLVALGYQHVYDLYGGFTKWTYDSVKGGS